MLRPLFLYLVLLIACLFAPSSPSQEPARIPPTPPPATIAPAPDYPDSTSGLEHLAKDIIKAQKENDGARADALLRSLILPTPRVWYETTFGPVIAKSEGMLYASATPSLPATLAGDFLNAQNLHFSRLEAFRFDKSCDDYAGELIFGILHARLEPVPFYQIRFFTSSQLLFMYAFAYVDGGFRFILPPKLEGDVFPANKLRVKIQELQADRIVMKVHPEYPIKARLEKLQGTVLMHALIGEDGSLKKVYVLKGYCSLAEAALSAVKQWRYSQTIVDGQPAEVDTTLRIDFSLRR